MLFVGKGTHCVCTRGPAICTPNDAAKPSTHPDGRGCPKKGHPPVVGRRRAKTFTARPGLAMLLTQQGFIPEAPCCSGTAAHRAPYWAPLLEQEEFRVPKRA